MPDREKVTKGLEACALKQEFVDCKNCPYHGGKTCVGPLMRDALALLKEQEAECELDERCEDCKEYDKEKHYCPRFCRVIRTTLDEVKGNEPRWIPVTERPPEDGEDMIAWIEDEHESRMTAANYDKGVWYDCVMNCKEQRIKYWMPKPKPPKEDTQ